MRTQTEKNEKPAWGLLGPETLEGSRRTRTLDIAAAIRNFNDLAVPGMGGVWFAKQLMLATLGVAIAERLREAGLRAQNIETANAVEALGCWLALKGSSRQQDPRIRGREKFSLDGDSDSLSFARMRKPGFYVTQPMRMATVQPLRALGLVEGDGGRFNAFRCTPTGMDFLDLALGPAGNVYRNSGVLEHLVDWAAGERTGVAWRNPGFVTALSPRTSMPKAAREYLAGRIVHDAGSHGRRAAALAWTESLRSNPSEVAWSSRPSAIDEAHWADLHVGAAFFAARDATLDLLDRTEAWIGNTQPALSLASPLPAVLVQAIEKARHRCRDFLAAKHDPTEGALASTFCRALSVADDAAVLREAVSRDGRVLRLRGDDAVVPGSAFQGSGGRPGSEGESDASADEAGATLVFDARSPWPRNASPRLHRLFQMNLDLRGELGDWLAAGREAAAA